MIDYLKMDRSNVFGKLNFFESGGIENFISRQEKFFLAEAISGSVANAKTRLLQARLVSIRIAVR